MGIGLQVYLEWELTRLPQSSSTATTASSVALMVFANEGQILLSSAIVEINNINTMAVE